MKIQKTHLSENRNEVRQIRDLFPWSRDYTDVYDRFGFLRPGSLFAHGVHLEERELQRLSESGSTIVHCPTSNSFLGSGLFCLRQALREDRPVAVGIGCDIGAGTSYSPFQTMREAYLVSQLTESHLTPIQAYYMYTLGNATRLGWEDELGSLEVGKFADLVIINPVATTFLEQRQELSEGINDELFAVMILGDDRVITQTYIAGQPMKSSSS